MYLLSAADCLPRYSHDFPSVLSQWITNSIDVNFFLPTITPLNLIDMKFQGLLFINQSSCYRIGRIRSNAFFSVGDLLLSTSISRQLECICHPSYSRPRCRPLTLSVQTFVYLCIPSLSYPSMIPVVISSDALVCSSSQGLTEFAWRLLISFTSDVAGFVCLVAWLVS